MRKYEMMFIVRPDLEEAEIKKVADSMKSVITDNDARIVEVKEMGQKELAYEIKKFKTGYYFLLVVEAEGSKAINEFNRIALINENVIRHLVVKIDE